MTFVTTASVPFGSDERAEQVQARRVERGAAEVDELAVRAARPRRRARDAR